MTTKHLPTKIKVLTTGDGTVGKTALLHRYTAPEEKFLEEYTPTIFEEFTKNQKSKSGKEFEMNLVDSAGQEGLREIMKFAFNDVDVFVLCFNPVEPNSFLNIQLSWIDLIRKASYDKKTLKEPAVVLVMTKSDLCSDPAALEKLKNDGRQPITVEQGRRMSQQIRAFRFLRCSSLRGEGIEEVFRAVADAAEAGMRKNERGLCSIL